MFSIQRHGCYLISVYALAEIIHYVQIATLFIEYCYFIKLLLLLLLLLLILPSSSNFSLLSFGWEIFTYPGM